MGLQMSNLSSDVRWSSLGLQQQSIDARDWKMVVRIVNENGFLFCCHVYLCDNSYTNGVNPHTADVGVHVYKCTISNWSRHSGKRRRHSSNTKIDFFFKLSSFFHCQWLTGITILNVSHWFGQILRKSLNYRVIVRGMMSPGCKL